MADVVTCFVRNRGKILLTRRSDAVGTYQGRWAGVSGYVEGDPDAAERDARRELREEVGLTDAELELVRGGEPLSVDDEEGQFTVHPFLFERDTREVTRNEELAAVEWVDPTAIRARTTVPCLWETWKRVAPTVETVREDRTHGSAWLAARALEVLRDAAADAAVEEDGTLVSDVAADEDGDRTDVAAVARDLRTARPEMAAIANAIDRVMAAVGPPPVDPDALVDRAVAELESSLEAGVDAARTAARRLRETDATAVATLSRSGTVRDAVAALSPADLVVAESRPEREGVHVAEWAAAETDASVTLTTEAALPSALVEGDVDAVLVGADSIHPDGDVVNKTGTGILALAAREADVPVYVAAATAKIRPADGDPGHTAVPEVVSSADAVYDGDADVSVHTPTFEVVPAGLVDGVATENGLLDASGVREIAAEHADNAAWTAWDE